MEVVKDIQDTKERILVAARELFIENGYNGTSIRDIASASEANVAHVNYYFQSKYNLFEIIFDEAFEVLIKRVFSIVRSDMPFFDLIEEWINAYYEILIEYPQIPIFILNEINHGSEGLMERIQQRNPLQIFTQLSKRIEEEVIKGTIKETPTIDFGLNVLSLCVFPFMFEKLATKVANKTKAEYNEVLEQHKKYVIEFVINALKP